MPRLSLLALALVAAGCVAPALETEPAPEETPSVERLAFDGRTERLACVVAAGTPTCHVEQGSLDMRLPDGPVTRLVATITWESSGPADEELQAYLLAVDENGEWSWEESPDTFARGRSPLVLDWDVTKLAMPYHHLDLHLASAFRGGTSEARYVVGSGVAWHAEAEVHR